MVYKMNLMLLPQSLSNTSLGKPTEKLKDLQSSCKDKTEGTHKNWRLGTHLFIITLCICKCVRLITCIVMPYIMKDSAITISSSPTVLRNTDYAHL